MMIGLCNTPSCARALLQGTRPLQHAFMCSSLSSGHGASAARLHVLEPFFRARGLCNTPSCIRPSLRGTMLSLQHAFMYPTLTARHDALSATRLHVSDRHCRARHTPPPSSGASERRRASRPSARHALVPCRAPSPMRRHLLNAHLRGGASPYHHHPDARRGGERGSARRRGRRREGGATAPRAPRPAPASLALEPQLARLSPRFRCCPLSAVPLSAARYPLPAIRCPLPARRTPHAARRTRSLPAPVTDASKPQAEPSAPAPYRNNTARSSGITPR